jgi:hypothetical protein
VSTAPEREHAWLPIPLEVGRYHCACGAIGRRSRSGEIRQCHDAIARSCTARPIGRGDGPLSFPTLDQIERLAK